MARVPEALRYASVEIPRRFGGVFSGIAPATPTSYGYHNTLERHLAGRTTFGRRDYSAQLPDDLAGIADLYSGLDWSLAPSQMIVYTRRMLDAADRGDPRMRYLREFYGTVDGRTVVGRTHSTPDAPWVAATADLSHLHHIHDSWFRRFANSLVAVNALLSVLAGESLAAYQRRTGLALSGPQGSAPPQSTSPSPGSTKGDTMSAQEIVDRLMRHRVPTVGGGSMQLGVGEGMLAWLLSHARNARISIRDEVLPALRAIARDVTATRATVTAIAAAQQGKDIAGEVRKELGKFRRDLAEQLVAELAKDLGPAVVAEIRAVAGELPEDVLTAAFGRALDRVRLSVDAG